MEITGKKLMYFAIGIASALAINVLGNYLYDRYFKKQS